LSNQLVDQFGRQITYLRMSVTDRCDFRCVYCMAEEMTFLPRAQILTLEELAFIGEVFVELGVRKLRITGGEPLIRHNIEQLMEQLGALPELGELTLTTNGSQLQRFAPILKRAGVKRLNVSVDSLRPDTFKRLTRTGDLQQVLAGIDAAQACNFEKIKLNAVVLKGRNEKEVVDLVDYAVARDFDIAFIEEMPLGVIAEHDRAEEFVSSQALRELIERKYELNPTDDSTGGPSRYWRIPGYQSKIGFISPHSENFCASCNRVRLTAEGRLLLCLGNEHSVDLKAVVRAHPGDRDRLAETIIESLRIKPERHYFDLDQEPQILRFMSATGG
jgi:cyclic pyranopterin phosphate synthase